jgi:hypothetical protein
MNDRNHLESESFHCFGALAPVRTSAAARNLLNHQESCGGSLDHDESWLRGGSGPRRGSFIAGPDYEQEGLKRTRQMDRSHRNESARNAAWSVSIGGMVGAGLAVYGGSESAMTQSESGGINIMAAQRGGSRSRRQPSQPAAGPWRRDRRLQRGGAGWTPATWTGCRLVAPAVRRCRRKETVGSSISAKVSKRLVSFNWEVFGLPHNLHRVDGGRADTSIFRLARDHRGEAPTFLFECCQPLPVHDVDDRMKQGPQNENNRCHPGYMGISQAVSWHPIAPEFSHHNRKCPGHLSPSRTGRAPTYSRPNAEGRQAIFGPDVGRDRLGFPQFTSQYPPQNVRRASFQCRNRRAGRADGGHS